MSLLISEPPLQVLPSLAEKIGLNEAIFLQQLHYWSLKSTHTHDGQAWVYNTIAQWREQFPFWCERTIKAVIANLKERGLLRVERLGAAFDRTNYYAVNYAQLALIEGAEIAPCTGQKIPRQKGQKLPVVHTENTQETTTEIIRDGLLATAETVHGNLITNAEGATQEACRKTWDAYKQAYSARYGVDPVRNARVNAQVRDLVKRIGHEEAPDVAAFFVRHNDNFLVRRCHEFGLLLSQAEAMRTQWATGRRVTATQAQQADRTQANRSAAEEAIAMRRARNEARP